MSRILSFKVLAMYIWVAATGAVAADPLVSAEGNLSPTELPFHHVARYHIQIDAPADATIEIAPWAASMPGLKVRREPPATGPATSGRQRFTQTFLLTPSIMRSYELPKVVVRVDGEPRAELLPQTLTVRDLTPEELSAAQNWVPLMTLAEARDRADNGVARYLLSAAALLVLFVVGLWYWHRPSAKHGEGLPWEVAGANLEALAILLERRRITGEQFYVALSTLLRDYVENRYNVTVRERSTPEVAEQLQAEIVMELPQSEALITLLRAFDRVKFAQRHPAPSQMLGELEQARDFITASVPPDPIDATNTAPEGAQA